MNLDPRVWGTVFPELLEPTGSIETRPILGFRVNRIQIVRDEHPFRLALTGLANRTYFWEPGKNMATCHRRGHRAPAPGCTCGLYASHDLSGVPWVLTAGASLFVLTAVAGTGIVRIHERGWRAQFAGIVAFSDEFPAPIVWRFGGRAKLRGLKVISRQVARALEEKYQVPVVPLKKLAEVTRSAGDFLEGQP